MEAFHASRIKFLPWINSRGTKPRGQTKRTTCLVPICPVHRLFLITRPGFEFLQPAKVRLVTAVRWSESVDVACQASKDIRGDSTGGHLSLSQEPVTESARINRHHGRDARGAQEMKKDSFRSSLALRLGIDVLSANLDPLLATAPGEYSNSRLTCTAEVFL
jgi:hypothetical protein